MKQIYSPDEWSHLAAELAREGYRLSSFQYHDLFA
jgi:hypothetical protein